MANPQFLLERDTLNGKLGQAFVTIDGQSQELFRAKKINVSADIQSTDVPVVGTTRIQQKTTGVKQTGTMSFTDACRENGMEADAHVVSLKRSDARVDEQRFFGLAFTDLECPTVGYINIQEIPPWSPTPEHHTASSPTLNRSAAAASPQLLERAARQPSTTILNNTLTCRFAQ